MTAERQLRFWLIGFALTVAGLYLLREMLLPFVAGMAVAYFLDPLADRLERAGCSRMLATAIITAVFVLLVVLAFVLLVPLLVNQIEAFVDSLPGYLELFRERLLPWVEGLVRRIAPDYVENLKQGVGSYAGEIIQWTTGVLKGVLRGGLALFNILSLIFITPIVTFYLLRDWDRLVDRIDGWLPRAHRETIRDLARQIDARLAGFVRGQGTVCLVLGTFYAIALSAVGLNFGLVVGLVAGGISFIPFVGTLVGFVVSVGLAFLQFSEWQWIAATAGIFIVGQVVEGNFLTPKLVGERVGLHPVWVIFALLAGGVLLGFVGVLLAVPVAATVGVLARFALAQYLKSRLYLGTDPGPGPDAAPPDEGEPE